MVGTTHFIEQVIPAAGNRAGRSFKPREEKMDPWQATDPWFNSEFFYKIAYLTFVVVLVAGGAHHLWEQHKKDNKKE